MAPPPPLPEDDDAGLVVEPVGGVLSGELLELLEPVDRALVLTAPATVTFRITALPVSAT